MKELIRQYQSELLAVRERIALLRQLIQDEQLPPMEWKALEIRRRLLHEEAQELERDIKAMLPYAENQAGDLTCV